jgi:uncharacterized protein (TIGR03437 family)
VVLNWPAVPTATSYVVQGRAISDGAYLVSNNVTATVNGSSLTYTDTNFDPFTAYAYRVFALVGNTPGYASTEAFVGPPPTGFSMAALTPKAVVAAQGTDSYGRQVSLTLDANGDPAMAFSDESNATAGNKFRTDVYFVGWDRAHHQWKAPVKIDTVYSLDPNAPEISAAFDPSTNRLAIAYESPTDSTGNSGANSVSIAFSTDGGVTWSKQQVFSAAPASLGSDGVSLQVANGQVFLLASTNPGPIYYITGAETAAPTAWTKTTVPAGNVSNPGYYCPYTLTLDSSSKPGVAFMCNDPVSNNGIVWFWRSPATTATRVLTGNGFQTGDDIRLAFSGANPRVLVDMQLNNLTQTSQGTYLTNLWLTASNDGGNTWTTPVQLPDDGNRALQFPITLAIGPQGQAAVSATDIGGNYDGVKCGWPKLIRSTDLAKWTACNPGNSPAPAVTDVWESASFASNGKLYLAFQHNSPGFAQEGFDDLPGGVILWREAPQPSNLPSPVVNVGGVVNNAGEVANKPVAPGSIIEIYGLNLGGQGYTGTIPLVGTLGPSPALTTSVTINGFPAPLYFTSAGQLDVQMPFEVTNVSSLAPGTTAGVQVTVNDSLSPVLPFTSNPIAPGIYVVINANGSVNPGTPAASGSVVTVYMTGLGAVNNAPADGAAAPSDPAALATVQGPVTATIGGQNASVLFAGLTPGSVGLYQVNIQVPSLASGTYTLLVSERGIPNANTVKIAVTGP